MIYISAQSLKLADFGIYRKLSDVCQFCRDPHSEPNKRSQKDDVFRLVGMGAVSSLYCNAGINVTN